MLTAASLSALWTCCVTGEQESLYAILLYFVIFSGFFTKDESENIIKNGTLNGLFVLGRSVGFIGHFLDQKRLKQGLYRHPWDDISYVLPEMHQ